MTSSDNPAVWRGRSRGLLAKGSTEGGPQQESQRILHRIEAADWAIQPVHRRETVVRAPDLSRDQKAAVMLHIPASLTRFDTDAAVGKLVDRLALRFPKAQREHIASTVAEEYSALSDSRIRTYIPNLVEHGA